MACYHPLQAYRCSDGRVVFTDNLRRNDVVKSLQLNCGQCVGCRLARSRHWATRCLHEASLYDSNCFITLTYDDEHLPSGRSLYYPDFQKFLKRVRRRFSSARVRFYMSGEYGEENGRPHYHALLFNLDFPDKVYWRLSPAGFKLYRSNILESLWPLGNSEIGGVSFESAAYVARYIMKKITGDGELVYLDIIDPDTGEVHSRLKEFNRMSLKPGIGAAWLAKYFTDCYPAGKVVVNEHECNTPKYYDKLFKRGDFAGLSESLDFSREMVARSQFEDSSDDRLAVRERVARARVGLLKRTL